jgi:type I restriction enzyme S subunit
VNDESAAFNYSSKRYEEKFLVRKGDLLFAWSASLGAFLWSGDDAWLNQHIFKVKPHECIDKRFLYYALVNVVNELISRTHGSGMVHITKGPFLATEIPLPPKSDQQAIVAKIEELLSDLQNGVRDLRNASIQLQSYRSSVLKEAFEGRLSSPFKGNQETSEFFLALNAKRRGLGNDAVYERIGSMQLPELPNFMKWVCIGDISYGVEYGSAKKSDKQGDVVVLRMGNLKNGGLDWGDLAFSSDKDEIEKYSLKKDDVLFNRTNSPELVGKTSIYLGERPAIFAGYLIRINQFEEINAKYLNYFMNSPIAKLYGREVKTDGVNQSNISGRKLSSYPFPLCGLREQDEIVRVIESRLSACDRIEQNIRESLKKADILRRSIIKNALDARSLDNLKCDT